MILLGYIFNLPYIPNSSYIEYLLINHHSILAHKCNIDINLISTPCWCSFSMTWSLSYCCSPLSRRTGCHTSPPGWAGMYWCRTCWTHHPNPQEPQFRTHSSATTFLVCGRSSSLWLSLATSLFRSATAYNSSQAGHQTHTFQNNAYHLLWPTGRSLATLSSDFGCPPYISEPSQSHTQILYRTSSILGTICHRAPGCTSLSISGWPHLSSERTYCPFRQYPMNTARCRTLRILHRTCRLLMAYTRWQGL